MQLADLKARIVEYLLERDEAVAGGDLAVRFATEPGVSLELFDDAMRELEDEGAVVSIAEDDGMVYRHPETVKRLAEPVRSVEGYRRLIREYLAARPGWHDGSELAREVGALADVHFGSPDDPLYPDGPRGDFGAFVGAVRTLVTEGVVDEREFRGNGEVIAEYRHAGEQ